MKLGTRKYGLLVYVILNTCDVCVEFLDCVGIMDLTGRKENGSFVGCVWIG